MRKVLLIISLCIVCLSLQGYRRTMSVLNDYNELKKSTIIETNKYINNITTKSELDTELLLNKCISNDIDFIFVLAQAQLESHFGTVGIAAKTNSVWNVNSWDGHSAEYIINNGRGYNHPNQSIDPYINLLQNKYLVNGKTEMDMMNNFVNMHGHRYASDKNYEKRLKRIYKKISDSEVGKLYKSLNFQ